MLDELLPDLIIAVEQQLISPQTPYVKKAFERLCKLGIDPSAAKTQIATCLAEEMNRILESRKPFDEKSYRELLDELPFPDEGAV
jgi:Domain of unknown function (DUF1841)